MLNINDIPCRLCGGKDLQSGVFKQFSHLSLMGQDVYMLSYVINCKTCAYYIQSLERCFSTDNAEDVKKFLAHLEQKYLAAWVKQNELNNPFINYEKN